MACVSIVGLGLITNTNSWLTVAKHSATVLHAICASSTSMAHKPSTMPSIGNNSVNLYRSLFASTYWPRKKPKQNTRFFIIRTIQFPSQ